MAIYEIAMDRIQEVSQTSFSKVGIRERGDLQRLLREQIQIVSPDTLVISEEFGEWEDSRRRIDLLGLDKDANLVVIELKRTDDGGHMELQALRYAAMVSAMTFDQAVETYESYLEGQDRKEEARDGLLRFLDWEEPNEDQFAQKVRIVLVSAEFSKEITTSVIWLNEKGLDVRCVRLKPYHLDERTLVDVQQVIPLPEAAQYQVRIQEKKQLERKARAQKWNEAMFIKELGKRAGTGAVDLVNNIHAWILPLVDEIPWGNIEGRFVPTIYVDGLRVQLFVIRPNATIAVRFVYLSNRAPFNEPQNMQELLRRLNEIPNLNLPADAVDRRPNFPLERLAVPAALAKFKNTIEWMIEELRSHNRSIV
jgi:RecB family endonuclease NucS